MNITEVAEFLVANGYAYCLKGTYKLTTKFHRDLKAVVNAPAVTKALALAVTTDWEQMYKQFIIDARVPARGEGKFGDTYSTNKYSEGGMKAFRKAIESGYTYEMLVMATALYYKSGIRMKQAIGRYMEEGAWKSDYDALAKSAEENRVSEHIKETTDDGQYTFTKLG